VNFNLSPHADTNGTFLATHLPPEVRRAVMLARFGDPMHGVWDTEKGYSGEEWTFVDGTGAVYTVYARWGMFRVGAHSTEVTPFVEWLVRELV
jgi:hypothetical protein